MLTKTIAILIEDLYQDLEVWYPYYRLQEAGHQAHFIGREKSDYTGKFGYPLHATKLIKGITVQEYDAVIIPGGFAPDLMRKSRAMIDFVRAMSEANKIVAAICHGAWIPASAGILKDRQATCYYAIADDIIHAGAHYTDQPVVVDGNVITSRQPGDLPQFCQAILAAL